MKATKAGAGSAAAGNGQPTVTMEFLATAAAGRWPWAEHLRALVRLKGFASYREFVLASQATAEPISWSTLNHIFNSKRIPQPATIARLLRALDATPADLVRAVPLPDERISPAGRPRRRPPPPPSAPGK